MVAHILFTKCTSLKNSWSRPSQGHFRLWRKSIPDPHCEQTCQILRFVGIEINKDDEKYPHQIIKKSMHAKK